MNTEITTAMIALLGTAIGTFGGIITSSKLTIYRIEQLEKKMEKHNSVMERTLILEEKLKTVCERIDCLEER